MKKYGIWMTALLILCVCWGTAFAEETNVQGVESMPAAVQQYIDTSRWAGWEVTGWTNPDNIRSSTACGFAAVKNGKQNVLLAFGWKDDGWVYKWYNAAALPQVEAPILLGQVMNRVAFASCYVYNEEIQETTCIWERQTNGSWRLTELYNFYPFMFFDTSVDNALRLYNVGWVEPPVTDVWVYGSYQTNLRYFNLAEFPMTVAEAREKLSNPPKIPSGTLAAKKIAFTSGKKYEVFQGPGEEYGQAGEGKAVVSTNDWVQVFGQENGWVMIQYDITSDHMRIGWISADSLPKNATVTELQFTPILAMTAQQVDMTDDPLFSQASMASLPRETQVNWLATMGEWAYIETTDAPLIRGFVPVEALALEQEDDHTAN